MFIVTTKAKLGYHINLFCYQGKEENYFNNFVYSLKYFVVTKFKHIQKMTGKHKQSSYTYQPASLMANLFSFIPISASSPFILFQCKSHPLYSYICMCFNISVKGKDSKKHTF